MVRIQVLETCTEKPTHAAHAHALETHVVMKEREVLRVNKRAPHVPMCELETRAFGHMTLPTRDVRRVLSRASLAQLLQS